jgi:hypothetical protein
MKMICLPMALFLKQRKLKISDFGGFQLPTAQTTKKKKCQIPILDFQCVAKI